MLTRRCIRFNFHRGRRAKRVSPQFPPGWRRLLDCHTPFLHRKYLRYQHPLHTFRILLQSPGGPAKYGYRVTDHIMRVILTGQVRHRE